MPEIGACRDGILTAQMEVEICGLDVEFHPDAIVFSNGIGLMGKQESEWGLAQLEAHKLRRHAEETMVRSPRPCGG